MYTVGWDVAESAEPRTSLTGKKVTERGNEETFGENYMGSEKINKRQGDIPKLAISREAHPRKHL